mmetsp:Transcript_102138/g.153025  ORF Transcript_102138/g.153025 Transcript_102138/m.153025 type:complete len:232 (-) Transcript_102138:160-855(-)
MPWPLFISQRGKLGSQVANLFSFRSLSFRFLQIQGTLAFLVGLFELLFVFLEVLSHLVDLSFGEQAFARAPKELIKGLEGLLTDLLTLERPDDVTVVHGKLEVSSLHGLRHTGSHSSSRGVPNDLIGSVMLFDDETLRVDIVKFQSTRSGVSQTGEQNGLSGRTPKDKVALLSFQGLDQVEFRYRRNLFRLLTLLRSLLGNGDDFGLFHHVVKADADLGRRRVLGVYHGEP